MQKRFGQSDIDKIMQWPATARILTSSWSRYRRAAAGTAVSHIGCSVNGRNSANALVVWRTPFLAVGALRWSTFSVAPRPLAPRCPRLRKRGFSVVLLGGHGASAKVERPRETGVRESTMQSYRKIRGHPLGFGPVYGGRERIHAQQEAVDTNRTLHEFRCSTSLGATIID